MNKPWVKSEKVKLQMSRLWYYKRSVIHSNKATSRHLLLMFILRLHQRSIYVESWGWYIQWNAKHGTQQGQHSVSDHLVLMFLFCFNLYYYWRRHLHDGHKCHVVLVEIRGQLCEVGFLHSPLCKFQELTQVAMLTWQVPLSAAFPSHLTDPCTNFTVATTTIGNSSALMKTFTFS